MYALGIGFGLSNRVLSVRFKGNGITTLTVASETTGATDEVCIGTDEIGMTDEQWKNYIERIKEKDAFLKIRNRNRTKT
jgi:hypothetical protein